MEKKLYRSKKEHIIAGVAGGLAEYFDIDPVIVRVIFVFLALVQGIGILLYLILVIVIPKKGEKETAEQKIGQFAEKAEDEVKEVVKKIKKGGLLNNSKQLIGLIIIVIGLFFLLNKFFTISWFRWDIFWPIALIVVGFYVLIKKTK